MCWVCVAASRVSSLCSIAYFAFVLYCQCCFSVASRVMHLCYVAYLKLMPSPFFVELMVLHRGKLWVCVVVSRVLGLCCVVSWSVGFPLCLLVARMSVITYLLW